jgi:nicotinate-nucleotide adenylyltransferase
MKIGLFFGSFNPVHIGHMAIANYMVEFSDLDQIWFIVSPHNPLKEKKSLLGEHHRLQLLKEAIGDDKRFKASNIEFKLPQPSYTIHTLAYLSEKFPEKKFVLIIGSDNLRNFNKWKNHEEILRQYQLYVYPRSGYSPSADETKMVGKWLDAPLMEISSTFIRESIRNKKNVRHFLSESVYRYLTEMHFYTK